MDEEVREHYQDYLMLKSIMMYKIGDKVGIKVERKDWFGDRVFVVSPSGLMYFYQYYGTWRNGGIDEM